MNPTAQRAANLLGLTTTAGDPDLWDGDGNQVLDPFAGHGTFIAGIIANLAPGAHVHVERALSSYGDTDDATIAQILLDQFPDVSAGVDAGDPPFDVVSMSFGGFCEEDDPPVALANAIAAIQAHYAQPSESLNEITQRVVFVASAGNCRFVSAHMACVVRKRHQRRSDRPRRAR